MNLGHQIELDSFIKIIFIAAPGPAELRFTLHHKIGYYKILKSRTNRKMSNYTFKRPKNYVKKKKKNTKNS